MSVIHVLESGVEFLAPISDSCITGISLDVGSCTNTILRSTSLYTLYLLIIGSCHGRLHYVLQFICIWQCILTQSQKVMWVPKSGTEWETFRSIVQFTVTRTRTTPARTRAIQDLSRQRLGQLMSLKMNDGQFQNGRPFVRLFNFLSHIVDRTIKDVSMTESQQQG